MGPLRCFECRTVGHKRLSCPQIAVQPRSSWSVSAGIQRQRRGDSQPENTEESESAVVLSDPQTRDTPESRPKVSPERTDTTGTHTTLAADMNTTTDVNSASVDHDVSTVTSADSDPAPNVSSEHVQLPQISTSPLTLERALQPEPGGKERTHRPHDPSESVSERRDTGDWRSSKADTDTTTDIQEQANCILEQLNQLLIHDVRKRRLVKTLL